MALRPNSKTLDKYVLSLENQLKEAQALILKYRDKVEALEKLIKAIKKG